MKRHNTPMNYNHYVKALASMSCIILASNIAAKPQDNSFELSDLLTPRNAYAQSEETREFPFELRDRSLDELVRIYQTEVKDKVDFVKECRKVVDLLRPIESFIDYDFSQLDKEKRNGLASIFSDYALALKKLEESTNDKSYDKILNLYRLAIKIDPNLIEPRYNFAFLVYEKKLGNYQEAIDNINELFKKFPFRTLIIIDKLRLKLEELNSLRQSETLT